MHSRCISLGRFLLVSTLDKITRTWRSIRRGASFLLEHNRLDPFPIRRSIRGYDRFKARSDIRAGINVALLAFPQGMAYAYIGGLPIEYGIYGSAVAAMVGPFFSGSRFLLLGPTNATSVLLFSSFLALNVSESEKLAMLPLLVAMVGAFLIFCAICRVANLIQYVSRTVVTGYIVAAAFYIILNQFRKVLGIDIEIPQGTTFFGIIRLTAASLPDLHIPSLFVGVLTAVLFVVLKRHFRELPTVATTLFTMSLAIFVCDAALEESSALEGIFGEGLKMLHPIDAGTWSLGIPQFNYEWISQLAGTAGILAFLSMLEGAAIGKELAARAGEKIDTNQEIFGMGVANIACSFASGMPASGSLTRSQLNWGSGASTPLASILCGFVCVLGAYLLGPFIRFIPQAVLGVLVITIGLSLINRREIRVVTKTTRSDAIVFVATFGAAVFVGLAFGIVLGTAISIGLFLRKAATPELVEYAFSEEGYLTQLTAGKRPDPEVSIVHVEGELFFGAAELFRDQMRRVVEDPNLKIVILKMRNAHHLDATSVLALEELIVYLNQTDRHLLVSEARKEVVRVFKNSGLMEILGRENFFADAARNPVLSTARAIKRARQILAGQSARVTIFAEGTKPSKRG